MNQNNKLYGAFSVCLFKAIMNGMENPLYAAIVTSFYIVILFLIIVVDLRWRRILNVIALPATAFALVIGLSQGAQTFSLAILGAFIGFLFFYVLYQLGKRLYGPGALGFGDVKLAMLLGAMVGLQHILSTLAFGLLLAGVTAVILLFFSNRFHLRSSLPYGAFLAGAGIIMLIWNSV